VIIETSGIADPVPLAHTLMAVERAEWSARAGIAVRAGSRAACGRCSLRCAPSSTAHAARSADVGVDARATHVLGVGGHPTWWLAERDRLRWCLRAVLASLRAVLDRPRSPLGRRRGGRACDPCLGVRGPSDVVACGEGSAPVVRVGGARFAAHRPTAHPARSAEVGVDARGWGGCVSSFSS
jgi:hypothetical protein